MSPVARRRFCHEDPPGRVRPEILPSFRRSARLSWSSSALVVYVITAETATLGARRPFAAVVAPRHKSSARASGDLVSPTGRSRCHDWVMHDVRKPVEV